MGWRLPARGQIGAREQFKQILISLQSSSHPWLTWKDTINNRAINNNTGTIHLSNLCTEICLPQDRDNISVCNLASINLSRHIVDGRLDFAKIAESARLAVRQLDNLIDITVSSVDEADHANTTNRAIGLGVMGFTDVVEKLGYSYDSEESCDLIDEIMEHVSWHGLHPHRRTMYGTRRPMTHNLLAPADQMRVTHVVACTHF